jgi:hypothetical protein
MMMMLWLMMLTKATIITKLPNTYSFKQSDDSTTETEDTAIAAEAIHGFMDKPTGSSAPAINSKIKMLRFISYFIREVLVGRVGEYGRIN